MKFLVIAKPRAGVQGLSSSVVQAELEYHNSLIAKGSADCIYSFVAGGGFGIVNADSHERVMEMIHDYPGYLFLEWEVHPICDYKTAFNKVIEMLRKQGM